MTRKDYITLKFRQLEAAKNSGLPDVRDWHRVPLMWYRYNKYFKDIQDWNFKVFGRV